MSSNWQNIAVPFVGGLDTSFDEVATPVARLRKLVNGYFNKAGSISKRPGYDKLGAYDTDGTITKPAKSLVSRESELLKVTENTLLSYVPSMNQWSNVGTCVPMSIIESTTGITTGEQTLADVATNDDLAVYAWVDADDGVVVSIYSTQGRLINSFVADASGEMPRVVKAANYITVFWQESGGNDLYTLSITTDNAATIASGDEATISATVTTDEWDVQSDPAGNYMYLVYTNSGDNKLQVAKVAPNGTVDSTSIDDTSGNVAYKSPSIAVNDSYWVVGLVIDGSDVAYATGSASGALPSALTVYDIATVGGSAYTHTTNDIKNLVAGITEGGNWRIYFTENDSSDYENNVIMAYGGTANGAYFFDVEDVFEFRKGCSVAGKPFTAPNGKINIPVVADSGPLKMQNTYLLYQDSMDSALYVPHPLIESFTAPDSDPEGELIGTFVNGVAADFAFTRHTPSTNRNGNVFTYAAVYKEQINATNMDKYGGHRVKLVEFDFDHKVQFSPTNESTLICSGLNYEYDGANAVESNFVFWPELDVDYTSTDIADHTAVTESGSSSITAGTYGYKFYYEWTNARGQRQRSTAVPFSVALTGSQDVNIVVPTLRHTRKQGTVSDVIIVGYRTAQDGSLYYRMTSPDPTATGDNGYYTNDYDDETVTVVDAMVDSTLIYNEIDPLTGGVLDHTLPVSAQWVTSTQKRVFLAGGGIPDSSIYYSKLRGSADPVEFFDGLSVEIDKKGGAITALAVLNENIVVFKNNHIFMLAGDGPNNNGLGDFNKPFEVATTVGCNNANSVVLTPLGLIFQSDKGFYLLQKNYSVSFIGAPAEDFRNQVHTATVIPDSSLVMFLAETGETVVYDFRRNQWSTYSNHLGVDAVQIRDDYYYVNLVRGNRGGDVLQRNVNSYKDAGSSYGLELKTAPLRFEGLQQYWRARKFSLVGTYQSDHELNVKVWYNREQYPKDDVTYDISDFIEGKVWGQPPSGELFWTNLNEYAETDSANTLMMKTGAAGGAEAKASVSFEGDFDISFTVPTLNSSYAPVYVAVSNLDVTDYGDLDLPNLYSLELELADTSSSNSVVGESQSTTTSSGVVIPSPDPTDVWQITRVGTTVTVYRNASSIYEGVQSYTGTMYVYGATFVAGSKIVFDYGGPTWGDEFVWGGDDKEYQVQHRFERQKVQAVTIELKEKRPTGAGFSINELALEFAEKSGLGRIGKTRKK